MEASRTGMGQGNVNLSFIPTRLIDFRGGMTIEGGGVGRCSTAQHYNSTAMQYYLQWYSCTVLLL